jgi:hypothetical protein
VGVRGTGTVEIDLRPGEHVCSFFRHDEERDAVLAPFVRQGLVTGHRGSS